MGAITCVVVAPDHRAVPEPSVMHQNSRAPLVLGSYFTCKSGVKMTVPSMALMIEDKFVRTVDKILCMRCTSCEKQAIASTLGTASL